MATRRILAMGGGGFSMEPENPLLDDFLLSLAPSGRRARVCFVPTASGDSADYIGRFRDAFGPERAEASVLSLFSREYDDLAAFLRTQDVVYVGGGSTANLLAVWRVHGLDRALVEAYEGGVVLAGLSAGMNCWFQASVTDSFSASRLEPLHDGLGLLAGSACPHYDGEELRAPTYRALVSDGFPPGLAADDGCALLFQDGSLADVVCSRPQAGAYHVHRGPDGVEEAALTARYLGAR
jgi:dipeptidase E